MAIKDMQKRIKSTPVIALGEGELRIVLEGKVVNIDLESETVRQFRRCEDVSGEPRLIELPAGDSDQTAIQ